ncbi:hypothetical protein Vafri_12842 [Volvox africanus]|uniref:Uncharacterized protein n=1 Tax=Volvox africanus TaxID=51714 RepID=A0A8J4BFM1_9CHLO|nr:hypothetical protein Vafri_12842 [Volvox africanus]
MPEQSNSTGQHIAASSTHSLRAVTPADRSGLGAPQGIPIIPLSEYPAIAFVHAKFIARASRCTWVCKMVVGPSLDGGYYLLGLTRLEPRLFQGMRWSTDSVLADTLERATSSGLRIAPLSWLPCLRDVDTLQVERF